MIVGEPSSEKTQKQDHLSRELPMRKIQNNTNTYVYCINEARFLKIVLKFMSHIRKKQTKSTFSTQKLLLF